MMPAIGRLKTRPEFLKVAATGAKWVTPGLILQMRQRPAAARTGDIKNGTPKPGEEDEIRVGFTVSRKVGNAVRRNRARRRLRAAAGDVLAEIGRPGCDYVVIGRARTLDRPYRDLVQDLRTAIERIGTKQPRKPRPAHKGRSGRNHLGG